MKAEESFQALSARDICVLAVGVTGSGKSTFINHLVDEEVPVGHLLSSETQSPRAYEARPLCDRKVWFIDTPGLDDTSRNDIDVILAIVGVLNELYARGVRIFGVLYFHNISTARFTGSSMKTRDLLMRILGSSMSTALAVVTTFWDRLSNADDGAARAEQLMDDFFYGVLFGSSAHKLMFPFNPVDGATARNIATTLLDRCGATTLVIQSEMVDHKLSFEETSIYRYVRADLLKVQEEYKKTLQTLLAEAQSAIEEKDAEFLAIFREEQSRYEQRSKELEHALDRLTRGTGTTQLERHMEG